MALRYQIVTEIRAGDGSSTYARILKPLATRCSTSDTRLHRPLRDILRIFLMEKLPLSSHPDLGDQPTVAIQKSSARSPDADPNTMHRTVANCRRRLDGAVEHTRNRTVHVRLRWENIWQIINYVPPGSIWVRFHKKARVCKEADTSFRMGFIRLCFRSSVWWYHVPDRWKKQEIWKCKSSTVKMERFNFSCVWVFRDSLWFVQGNPLGFFSYWFKTIE